MKYSVLLLCPDYLRDYDAETFYTFVTAPDPQQAVSLARAEAVVAAAAQEDVAAGLADEEDFVVLLVVEGYHRDLRHEVAI